MQPSARVDLALGLGVEQRHAVPEDVPVAVRDEPGALADGELRLRPDPDERALVADHVVMSRAQGPHRRPLLAVDRDVLTGVLADRAVVARVAVLHAARHTDR